MKRFFNSPVIILLIIMVGINIINGGYSNPGQWFIEKLIMLPGIIIGLSFHEYAHGAVSYMLGDPTPKQQGRLTINPMAHIDPFGFIALLIAGFGWGVPVEIDPRYYKHKRRDELFVSLAGVVMNFMIAFIFMWILKLLIISGASWLSGTMGSTVIQIIQYVVLINLVLMIFNLLPVPPLDGFGILTQIFDLRKYGWYNIVYQNGFAILIVLIMLNVTSYVVTPAVNGIYSWMLNLIIY